MCAVRNELSLLGLVVVPELHGFLARATQLLRSGCGARVQLPERGLMTLAVLLDEGEALRESLIIDLHLGALRELPAKVIGHLAKPTIVEL